MNNVKRCCICNEWSPGWPDEIGWIELPEARFGSGRWSCARCWANLHEMIEVKVVAIPKSTPPKPKPATMVSLRRRPSSKIFR